MPDLKQNQIDYKNFLRANKNLSFNKSMKEFRKFGGHIGSNSASQVYRNSENKIIHTKKVKELKPKREIKLKVKYQEIYHTNDIEAIIIPQNILKNPLFHHF